MNYESIDDKFLYTHNDKSSDLVVIFSGYHAKSFMGFKLLENLNASKLFIRDPSQAWYNKKIDGLSSDANELFIKIRSITDKFPKESITFLGSSMGGYAALLFGIKLDVFRILVFGPQVILNPLLPNCPQSLDGIIYPDLSELILNNDTSQIDYFMGIDEFSDFYHLRDITQSNNLRVHCIVNSPHNVMGYLHSIQELQPILYKYFTDNRLPSGLFTSEFWQKESILGLIIKAIEAYVSKNHLSAISYTKLILEESPCWSGAWVFISKLYRLEKQYKNALKCAEKSVLLNKSLDVAHHELGMITFAYRDYSQATQSFKSVIELASSPKLVDYIKLCICYREQGLYDEAYHLMVKAKSLFPNSYGVFFHIGKILELKNNLRASLAYYRKALMLNPNDGIISVQINALQERIQNENSQGYKILCGGDTILTRFIHYYYEAKGSQWITDDLQKLASEAKISMLNLECVIAKNGQLHPKKEYRPFHYRGAPELAKILLNLNVSVAFTANNHAVDFGPEALMEQKTWFTRLGIATPGSGQNFEESIKPAYIKTDKDIIAIVSVFTFSEMDVYRAGDNKPGVFHSIDKNELLDLSYQSYLEARQVADIVIISPHWTQNWTTAPCEGVVELAHSFIDMGYDAVLGHSSHLMHGIELYKNHPIIYDMGTMLADYAKGQQEMPYQAVFMLHINDGAIKAVEIVPIELKNGRTIIAKAGSAKKIRQNVKERTHSLCPSVEFFHEGERLIVEFSYENYKPIQKKPSEYCFSGKFNEKSLTDWMETSSSILIDERNLLKSLAFPIYLKNSAKVVGITYPEVFYKGAGFLLCLYLYLGKGFNKDNYQWHLVGVHEKGKDQFYNQFPVSQGIFNPHKWDDGLFLKDETIVRPMGNFSAGMYKLYIGFKNMTQNTFQHSIDISSIKTYEKLICIGEIRVLDKIRGNFASGLDWSGNLSDVEIN